jgi:hypothetical protein
MDRSAPLTALGALAVALLAGCAPAIAERALDPAATPPPAVRPPARVSDVNGDGRTVVACLGDSNTDPVFNAKLPGGSWCERLARRYGATAEFHNFGAGGGTIACDFPLPVSLAAVQLDEAIVADADAIVLAFITNDARYAVAGSCTSLDPARRQQGRPVTRDEIGRELAVRLRDLVREGRTPRFWILLAPPALPPEGPAINETISSIDRRLGRRYARSGRVEVIEHPALERADYADALHMSASGQDKRARAVGAALFGEEDAP